MGVRASLKKSSSVSVQVEKIGFWIPISCQKKNAYDTALQSKKSH